MSVFRVEKNKNYTVMSNHHLKERQMSLKAKGLLSLMLSLPDNWNYTLAGLVTLCKENETAIRSALAELKKFGYLEIHQNKPTKENGGRMSYDYVVYENPIQQDKKQATEILYIENPIQLNTNLSNTDNNINIISDTNNPDFISSEINTENSIPKNAKCRKKKLTAKQKKELAQLEEDKKIKKLIDEFTDDEIIHDLLEKYVNVRKQRSILNSAQVYIMLEDLKTKCGQNKAYTKDCIRQAIAGGWSQIVFLDNHNKYSTSTNYSNVDNTKNHFTGFDRITDDEFNKLTQDDKIRYLNNTAIANMTEMQKQFFDEYCLVADTSGNILTF